MAAAVSAARSSVGSGRRMVGFPLGLVPVAGDAESLDVGAVVACLPAVDVVEFFGEVGAAGCGAESVLFVEHGEA